MYLNFIVDMCVMITNVNIIFNFYIIFFFNIIF
jgi:hypothetical protein